MDKTIVQLIDANADSGSSTNSSGFNVVMYIGVPGASNMSVLDLTIDCNYAGVSATTNTGLTNLTLEAVVLSGNNNRIERVKAINAVGLRSQTSGERWTPSFGQENAEIKLGSQVPLD